MRDLIPGIIFTQVPFISRMVRWLGVSLILVSTALLLGEGFCSFGIFLKPLISDAVFGPASFIKPDPLLGWTNRPNVRIKNAFNNGSLVTTNSHGFRGDREIDPKVPAGKIRILCSGDSFTFGSEVGDRQTWCSQLETLDEKLETVNLGEPNYGVDQAFLKYRSVADDLAHHIHLFAFITEDFDRMLADHSNLTPRPMLGIRNDALIVRNYPVKPPPRFKKSMPARSASFGSACYSHNLWIRHPAI